jgi:hypothetical protein
MDKKVDTAAIQALLAEASETHHRVYRIVNGSDPDWASWYTDWLINLSELASRPGFDSGAQRACVSTGETRQRVHG